MRLVIVALLLAACAAAPGRPAGPPDSPPLPPDRAEAQAAADAYLAAHAPPGQVVATPIESAALAALWPSRAFFVATFPQWPVAVSPPAGFAPSNVLVVEAGAVTVVAGREALDALFAARFPAGSPVPVDDATAVRAARAYLELTFGLVQDGFWAFEIVEAEVAAGEATARALVTAGGNGELRVRLRFAGGFVAALSTDLHRGPRPRCHATKLLDPDPLVRQIVRDDLLFMGRAALPYLRARRALAAPDLAAAIDNLVDEIERRDPPR